MGGGEGGGGRGGGRGAVGVDAEGAMSEVGDDDLVEELQGLSLREVCGPRDEIVGGLEFSWLFLIARYIGKRQCG